MANKKISELPYINGGKISGNTLVPLVTYFSAATGDTVHTYISDFQTYLISGLTGNTDVFVTGGTYSAGTITLTNNTGGTFNVTGVTFSGGSLVSGDYLPLSGGTVSGSTLFTNGLSANTISATTYLNLPVNTDVFVTGGTYNNNTFTYTNSSGGSFNVTFNTVSGLTINGNLSVTGNTSLRGLTATTISATTYQNLPVSGLTEGSNISLTNNNGNYTISVTGTTGGGGGDYLPLSGGTVTGNTTFTSGLTVTGNTSLQSISGSSLDISGNSSSDLVKITQTGSGNAFVVEDSSRPDTTPFVITSGGSVTIGVTEPFTTGDGEASQLTVSKGPSGVAFSGLPTSTTTIFQSNTGQSIAMFTPDGSVSQIYFGTPSDPFGSYLRWDYTNRNLILATANSTGKLIFQTANAVEVARIDQNGNMGIGLTGATQKLEVSGNTKIYGGLTVDTIVTTGLTANTLTISQTPVNSVSPTYILSRNGSTGDIEYTEYSAITRNIDPFADIGSVSTINWNISGNSANYKVTLTASTTLNILNVRDGDYGTILITQDSVGGRTITLGTINGTSGSGRHKVSSGGAGSIYLTNNPNAVDIVSFVYDGNILYWTVGNDYT